MVMDTPEMLWEPPGKAEGAWLKFNFGQVAPYSVSAALVLVLIYVSISGKQSPRSLAWGRDFLESVTATVSPPSLTIINSFSGAFGTYSNSCMGLSENYTTRSPLRLQPLAAAGHSLEGGPCESLGSHRLVVGRRGICKTRPDEG